MRIVLINHSDSKGGASVVTLRLAEALRKAGHEATVLVTHSSTENPLVVKGASDVASKAAFINEHLRIFTANGFNRSDLFKVSAGCGGTGLHRHPLVRRADAVILNWVNQGMMSLREIGHIARRHKVLWTMHDMWNLTGICHHAGTCNAFETGCSCCPLLHSGAGSRDLAWRTAARKASLYNETDIRFVAVSSWLADKCRRSALMRDADVTVIPNAFPTEEFHTAPRMSRSALGLPEGKKLILMGAARLDDPIKGLPYAIEALNGLEGNDFHAVFFGNLRDSNALRDLKTPFTALGAVSDMAMLRDIYAHATALMSTSLYETLPGTLIEAQAAGCTPVSFDSGGQRDIIDKDSGLLVKPYDTRAFSHALRQALDRPFDREKLHASVNRKFGSAGVAKQYIDLISR